MWGSKFSWLLLLPFVCQNLLGLLAMSSWHLLHTICALVSCAARVFQRCKCSSWIILFVMLTGGSKYTTVHLQQRMFNFSCVSGKHILNMIIRTVYKIIRQIHNMWWLWIDIDQSNLNSQYSHLCLIDVSYHSKTVGYILERKLAEEK